MNSKKLNIFAFIMVFLMFGFSIFIGLSSRGKDGMSSYELAKQNGLISSSMTELEYLESLQGKNGSNVSIEDIYNEYLNAKNLSKEDLSYEQFIISYFPDKLISDGERLEKQEYATQTALRSTVDICYSYYMTTETIYVTENTLSATDEEVYVIDSSKTNLAQASAAAGSGVIYQMSEDTAYIITNYHVLYIDDYSNDDNYRVYANETTGSFFTANYDSSLVKTTTVSSFPSSKTASYIKKSDLTNAPIETHFLDTYGVYVYGFQSEQYEISAKFVGGSADNDIAVLKVEKNANPNNALLFSGYYKEAELEDTGNLREGQTVIAIGNPLLPNGIKNDNYTAQKYAEVAKQAYVDALCLTATSGDISSLSEYCMFQSLLDSESYTNMRLMRVSAAINSGNSGGGLYNIDGKLVGIVNGKIANEKYDNVGYVIPLNVATRIADQIINQCDRSIQTRIMAINSENLDFTTENGKSNSYYDGDELVFVLSHSVVAKNVTGLASSSGLKNDDIIKSIKIGEKTYEVNNSYDINDILLSCSYGTGTITFNLSRYVDGQFTDIVATLNYNQTHFKQVI